MTSQATTVHRAGREPLPDGRSTERWTLAAPGGITVELLDLGARLQSVRMPDRHGHPAEVVLGAADGAQLLGAGAYFGATVGRYGNRIARGELPLDGAVHALRTQPAGHTLHGGPDGFATRSWAAVPVANGVRFHLASPDGDQGFPGTLDVSVSYLLDADGDLTIRYEATTDAPTVVNLTNHAYFNLAGTGGADVGDHLLHVHADAYLPVDADLIPLGPPAAVAGTPFDLTRPTLLAGPLGAGHPQLALAGGGFDHNWILRPAPADRLRPVAELHHPASGRRLECLTTEPGLQVYTGNLFDGATGPAHAPHRRHAGIALETQHFPDSPHHPETYPSTVLRPGETYRSTTVYRFRTTNTPAATADSTADPAAHPTAHPRTPDRTAP
ncbi:aldose epimerase family protein [Streptomyces sp. TLI_171]|uniref:aldose epimerase family protein n=1 Tax=Streptomyces sp. TLI_171 TaxID=1938859 RepID=UPI000C19D485|nr:aldose epimerase family protein [Streptomyces sp. TLI_171]RKE23394.1 aldose 1-epimerase [Streptomyces sp. TLI_171]